MKKIFFMTLVAVAMSACNSDSKFKVEGEVTGADGKMLYLEASALEGIVPLDSVKLKGDGSFSFKQVRPASPEFYRLRVEDKVINFSVDSTETVSVKAPFADFATAYTVEGSPNSSKIKDLTLKQMKLQNDVNSLFQSVQARKMDADVFEDSLAALLKDYKDKVKLNYIFAAPNTAAAYFALFQKLNDYLIFDPLNSKDDIKCFAAVATSLNNFYPEADRSKNLYNIVIKGMKNTRTPKQKVMEISEENISETGLIDISLRDMKGSVRKLSELKGKAVILDFTVYQSAVSATHNYMLRNLYDKYASQGLEIYQVSLDADEHYWKTTADNLPWICVRDVNGIYSTVAATYNVQNLPSVFLVNKNNELSARGETVKDLETAVKALL
ncbi:thioredoxin-like domain-containing protein [Bacteroides heparinolyticus]|uniref:thioredoxin-like domain-containing protein n=1 Tax=Prevotella heparinolytica TaxID=28113 RepID=UPI0035A0D3C2